jgi:hypothetical protein
MSQVRDGFAWADGAAAAARYCIYKKHDGADRLGVVDSVGLVERLWMLTLLVCVHPQVHVYFKRFDDAEALYRQMDRLDLAINLRSRLGDWFKVEKLLRESGGDDVALVTAWNKIGAYYSDRQKWAKAAHFYTQVILEILAQMIAWVAKHNWCVLLAPVRTGSLCCVH